MEFWTEHHSALFWLILGGVVMLFSSLGFIAGALIGANTMIARFTDVFEKTLDDVARRKGLTVPASDEATTDYYPLSRGD